MVDLNASHVEAHFVRENREIITVGRYCIHAIKNNKSHYYVRSGCGRLKRADETI